MTALGFAVAAVVGGLVRWQATNLNRSGLPLGTFGVNLLAAFVAGLVSTVSPTAAVIVATAYLGSMSTFSTVMGELVDLREQHGGGRAGLYALATVGGGVSVAWLGLLLAS